jgi:hypothetical protein
MTEMALGAKKDEIAHVSERRGGAVDEVGEACMRWSDEAPNQTRNDQYTNHISAPDMHRE